MSVDDRFPEVQNGIKRPRKLNDMRDQLVIKAMAYSGGNAQEAGRVIGLGRTSIYKSVRKLMRQGKLPYSKNFSSVQVPETVTEQNCS